MKINSLTISLTRTLLCMGVVENLINPAAWRGVDD